MCIIGSYVASPFSRAKREFIFSMMESETRRRECDGDSVRDMCLQIHIEKIIREMSCYELVATIMRAMHKLILHMREMRSMGRSQLSSLFSRSFRRA